MNWPLMITAGIVNTVGWVMFIVGKRQDRHNLMFAGVGLFGFSLVCADSWLWLSVSTVACVAYAWFRND